MAYRLINGRASSTEDACKIIRPLVTFGNYETLQIDANSGIIMGYVSGSAISERISYTNCIYGLSKGYVKAYALQNGA